jgi:hypothetical protein
VYILPFRIVMRFVAHKSLTELADSMRDFMRSLLSSSGHIYFHRPLDIRTSSSANYR